MKILKGITLVWACTFIACISLLVIFSVAALSLVARVGTRKPTYRLFDPAYFTPAFTNAFSIVNKAREFRS